MKYIRIIFIFVISTIFFLVFNVNLLAQNNGELDSDLVFSETEFADIDVLDWDEIEDIELIDEEDIEKTSLLNTDIVVIEIIGLFIDNAYYANPGIDSRPEDHTTKPVLVMKEVLIRKGDVMTVSALKRKIYFSQQNLDASSFVYSGSFIEYISLEEKNEQGHNKIKLFVSVKQGFLYDFGGGNTYALLGFRFPSGLKMRFYTGANRGEFHLNYEAISLGSKNDSFSSLFMNFGISNYFHWLSSIFHGLDHNTLLFGTHPFIGINFTPFLRINTGLGAFGAYTLENKMTDEEEWNANALPDIDQGGFYTLDSRSSIEITQSFGSSGMFDSYVELKIPYMIGSVLQSNHPNLSNGSIYDSVGFTLEGQYGMFLGLHHAIHIRGGFASNVLFTDIPFISKANLGTHFYDSTFIRLSRRGSYPSTLSIGNKAVMGSAEYRLGLFRKGIFALETFAFYDVGTVSDSFDTLQENIRFSIGPGLIYHFFSPVELMLKTSLNFGGPLLNQPDGKAFSFSIDVITRR